jgi:gliding motility-associated-like protein
VNVLLDFPNVFSPNGDHVHDFFAVKNSEFFENATMEIFNQWGDKIYVNKGRYNANWDGTHNGNELPVATYYYVFTPNKEGYNPVAGSISILR